MAENLPLIPEKQSALCSDVQQVLRDVFREQDYLPPLVSELLTRENGKECGEHLHSQQWIEKLTSEERKLYHQEEELKQDFAKRLAREPLPNIYKLHSPVERNESAGWRKELGIIERKHLRPSIEQDAGRDTKLWIKNILNRSSGNLSQLQTREFSKQFSVNLKPFDEGSLQSVSMGELVLRPPPPALPPELPPSDPVSVICIPPKVDFVNFTLGQLHTQSVRLVNVTKFEVKLSIRPPSRGELAVELRSRLALSAGASATVLLHYRPSDVRMLTDELLVRVSAGKSVLIPICCYMEPPLLDIFIPSVSSAQSSLNDDCHKVSDVLDLGAKLVGDVHRTPLIFHCETNLAAFFLLSDDAWINFTVDVPLRKEIESCEGNTTGVASDCFWISPTHWSGGGTVTGSAVCLARLHGVHTAAFKILCSTAIVRNINLLADAMLFRPDHVTLQAHEKDYDICSPEDLGCEHYVNLGIAFPHRSLAASVQIVNHTPVAYEYYWSIRRWGICSCWESLESFENGESELCPGASKPEDEDNELASYENARAVHAEPASGYLAPRSANLVDVRVPDVGIKLGVQRAVLMLVLKDIPKESISPGVDPMIVKTAVIEEDAIPGLSPAWSREVCDVVCTQMEVWWEVTPVCFVVHQPLLFLPHSRRIKSIKIPVQATQVTGTTGIRASWKVPECKLPEVQLKPGGSVLTNIELPLRSLPDEYPEMKTIELVAEGGEWSATARVRTSCSPRAPSLRPARAWLGRAAPAAPAARLRAQITLTNNTYQKMYWWGSSWRWWHENPVGAACREQAPCDKCYERTCTCALLKPSRGALEHGEKIVLDYDVYAPVKNGCVATLIQVRRTPPDLAYVPPGVGSEGRACLIAYRVMAPELMLRVLPCMGDKHTYCEACGLDEGPRPSQQGTPLLRPSSALTVGRCACYRLKCTNLTPLPTTLRWERPLEGGDILKVTFIPNDIEVGAYAVVELKVVELVQFARGGTTAALTTRREVVVKPLKVCRRRIFVHRASVEYSNKPVYLLIDAAVKGLEVTIEVPLGGAERTDASVIMRRSQMEDRPAQSDETSLTIQEYFEEDDNKREIQKENICHCRYKMVYIPPRKPLLPPKDSEDDFSIDIVTEPPPLTRICPCTSCSKPVIPENEEPICLQFRDLPIKTVRTRTITIRNLSSVTAQWKTAVRRWPRHHVRTLDADQWASDIRDPGIAIDCSPSQGVLTSRGYVEIAVRVYADCWGLYWDQILILIDHLEPIVLDLWIEAVGRPLWFAIKPDHEDRPPILWLSSSDPDRGLRVTNTSRADIIVQSFVIQEHGQPQDTLPFRLYIRFYDTPPRTCPCCENLKSESLLTSENEISSVSEEMDIAIELILMVDYGLQCENYYQVTPVESIILRGTSFLWQVRLLASSELIPPSVLLLRTIPVQKSGENWYRPIAAPQQVLLRAANRVSCLQLSHKKIRVTLCALDMPLDDVMRIRKPFQVHNVGNGHLSTTLHTASPWRVVTARAGCAANCKGIRDRPTITQLDLPPRSSIELCAEVFLHSREAWPTPGEVYPPQIITTAPLNFYDENHLTLASVQLILELELPIIKAEPANLDFGCVSDGDTRKNYVTVTHTSRSATIELVTKLEGSQDFQVWPQNFALKPGTKERIYVQYSARWRRTPVDGRLVVSAASGASRWARCALSLRGLPARGPHQPVRDDTDDVHLLPDHVKHLNSLSHEDKP